MTAIKQMAPQRVPATMYRLWTWASPFRLVRSKAGANTSTEMLNTEGNSKLGHLAHNTVGTVFKKMKWNGMDWTGRDNLSYLICLIWNGTLTSVSVIRISWDKVLLVEYRLFHPFYSTSLYSSLCFEPCLTVVHINNRGTSAVKEDGIFSELKYCLIG